VLAFWEAAAEGAHRPPDTATAVELLVARDPAALLLAVEGDLIVGSVIAGWDGWRCHLYRLAVLPTRRGEGLGGALIAAAEDRLAQLGGKRFDAMVLAENPLAHRAWLSAGYQPQPEWTRWIKPATALSRKSGRDT
jgi:ribosomal protein S18 acetylase RimI-like enzyme